MFVHRLFLEYFATLDTEQTQEDNPEATHLSRRSVVAGTVACLVGGGLGLGLTLIRALQAIPLSLQPGMPLYIYRKHRAPVYCVAWSPDGQYIASGSIDRTVHVWKAMTGEQILMHEGYTGPVIVIAWSPDGKYIASGSDDSTIQVWDVEQRHRLLTYQGHVGTGSVSGIAWSPDGKYIASGSGSGANGIGMLCIWESLNGHTVAIHEIGQVIVSRTAWSPNGAYIALGCSDAFVRIWDVASKEIIWTLSGHTGPVTGVAWSSDGTHIASCSLDTTSRIWSVQRKNTLYTLPNDGFGVYSLSWSPSNKYLVTGGIHGLGKPPVLVWNALDGTQILDISGTPGRIYDVAWSPNGQFISSASSDYTVLVWKAPDA